MSQPVADITVADLGELSTVHVSEHPEGSTAWVSTTEQQFVLIDDSGATPDGSTIIAPLNGSPIAGKPNARWVLSSSSGGNTQWLLQPTWYIDPANGNDQNRGDTLATALATYAEFRNRVGMGPVQIMMTVNLIGPIDEFIFHSVVTSDANSGIRLQGERTLIGTGTLTAVTLWDSTTNTEGTLTAAALPASWTASGFTGNLIELTSGASAGSVGWVANDNGAKTARYSPLIDPTNFNQGIPVVGNTFAVYSLTQLLQPISIQNFGDGFIVLSDLNITTPGSTTAHLVGSVFLVETCLLDGFEFLPAGEFVGVVGTRIHARTNGGDGGCFFINAFQSDQYAAAFTPASFLNIETRSLIQGAFLRASLGGVVQVEGGGEWIAIFDNDEAIRCESNSSMTFEGATFGQGIVTTGITVRSGACITYRFTPDITNPGTQVTIGGNPGTYAGLPTTDPATMSGMVLLA